MEHVWKAQSVIWKIFGPRATLGSTLLGRGCIRPDHDSDARCENEVNCPLKMLGFFFMDEQKSKVASKLIFSSKSFPQDLPRDPLAHPRPTNEGWPKAALEIPLERNFRKLKWREKVQTFLSIHF